VNPSATAASPNTQAADELNHLLRGELSAVESYEQALSKFEPYPAAAQELRRLRDEHRDTIRVLREHVTRKGGQPADSSGPWGAFVAAVTGTAKVIGPDTVLAALKRGEEHGIGEYQDALDKPGLPAECRELIRSQLLPRCERHLADLDKVRSFLS
jgi:uncharacterized protein (TIGR02284 family)